MSTPSKAFWLFGAACAAMLFAGCIADTPEDSDLPWSGNQGWEGMVPMGNLQNRYD